MRPRATPRSGPGDGRAGFRRSPVAALVAAAASAAGLAIVAAPVPGGVQLVDTAGAPYAWDLDGPGQPNVDASTQEVTFYVHAATLSDVVNGPKSAANAIRDAVGSWEVGTTRIRFREDPSRAASGRNGTDRVNWIGWSSSELSGATLAATFPTRTGGRIVDMDVVLNDRSFSWDTWTEGVTGDADIESLVAHEWGHAVGCDHVPLRASTMYFAADTGQVSLRSLAPDDVALVGAMYPNQTFGQTTATVEGRIDVAGLADDRSVHVVAVSVGSAEPAASTLSRPDGSFAIAGLPMGAYRLVAAPCHPLGRVMNEFWRNGTTGFLPTVLGLDETNPTAVRTVRAVAGETLDVGEVRVAAATAPLEPNDGAAQATPIEVGDAVSARFESAGDQDWFRFDATQGQRLTMSVLAWELGSDADPTLRLENAAGTAIQTVSDIRGASFARRAEGVDFDARIVAWAPPATGTYRLRVTPSAFVPGGQNFYVLLVTVASDAPSSILTEASASPPRIDADGVQESTIVVRPRREDGADVGPGATVQLLHSGAGTLGAVSDRGDGTYEATVTAPTTPGPDRFSVVVSTAQGFATSTDAVTVVYVGPVDPATSSLAAFPRRVADGESAEIRFTPRDAYGEALGPGRTTALSVDPDRGSTLDQGPIDDGAGTYSFTLTAGGDHGTSALTATVDAQATTVAGAVGFGFDVADVLAAAAADVTAFAATEGLPPRSARALATAAKRIASAQTALEDAAKFGAALARSRSALLSVQTALARSGGRLSDPGTPRELALAIRQAAEEAIDRAVIRTGRDQRLVDRARSLVQAGDSLFAAGKRGPAAARWLKARRVVAGLA